MKPEAQKQVVYSKEESLIYQLRAKERQVYDLQRRIDRAHNVLGPMVINKRANLRVVAKAAHILIGDAK